MGASYYTTLDADHLVSFHSYTTRSDTVDVAYVRLSDDGGATWAEPKTWPTQFPTEAGIRRRHPRGGYVDPATGRYISVWTEGVLPTDDPIEGMRQWKLHYSVSGDGGVSDLANGQIMHEGSQYNEIDHLPGISVGRNCVMIGDLGQRPLTRSDGVILIPVQSSPVGPDGDYNNPGAGFTYTDCLLLMGKWQKSGELAWTTSNRIVGDPARTTRGMIEPTIAELDDGSILMVMRGSNDALPSLPGHKWMARSVDGGESWSKPAPWTYSDGHPFFSPSACSQLIPHSSGMLLWMGNICAENPRGNSPRYPIVLGEVDRGTGLLNRESVTVIDDRKPGEHERLTLSNFYTREEHGSGDLLLHHPRFFAHAHPEDSEDGWTADLMCHRIKVDTL
jgi:hypothetical protein